MTEHPTRSHPQNQKATSDETSFFKTLVRVARYYPDGADKGAAYGKALGLRLMPWFPAHYENLRGEPWTSKVLNDYASSTKVKNYWGAGLSQLSIYKQAEVCVAVAVLQRDQVLQEGQAGLLVRLLNDSKRIASGMPDRQSPTPLRVGGWIQICLSGTGPGALTKVGFAADAEARLKSYREASRVEWHYRYWIEPFEAAVEVDYAIKKYDPLRGLRDEMSGTEVYKCKPSDADVLVAGVCALKGVKFTRSVNTTV